ncbi:MAG: helix-turn-helix domain-containing protein [Tolumonas sp.]|nr:helix-turn-helix domain-containing protein [Tolumonas sp.]
MQHKNIGSAQCPIARSLALVGEWWSLLIIRDAMHGLCRFDEFQKSLDIAPNMLSRRLNALVEAELLDKQPYSTRPLRYEYKLTAKGRELRPVLLTLLTWGNKYAAPEGECIQLADTRTGVIAQPVLVDKVSGREITEQDFMLIAGPAASDTMQQRLQHYLHHKITHALFAANTAIAEENQK